MSRGESFFQTTQFPILEGKKTMKTTKHKELAILLVGSLAVATPAFAKNGGADDNSSSSSSVSNSSSSACSSSSSGSSGRCKRAFTVSGVISAPGLETAFTCTNMEKSKSAILRVQIFSATGAGLNTNVSDNGTVVVGAGETATIATGNIESISGETIIQLTGAVNPPGAASVTGTTSKMVCNAYLAGSGATPAFMPLPLVKGTVQKGD